MGRGVLLLQITSSHPQVLPALFSSISGCQEHQKQSKPLSGSMFISVGGNGALKFGSIVFRSGANPDKKQGKGSFYTLSPFDVTALCHHPGGISVPMNYLQFSFRSRSWLMPAPGWARCARSCSLSMLRDNLSSQTQLEKELISTSKTAGPVAK